MNDIKFILGKGGLGRPLPGEDFISGLLFYAGSLPSGFDANNRIKQFFSIEDAEAAGILDDYSDAAAPTFTYLVTAAGTNGDNIAFKISDFDANGAPRVNQLGNYTKTAGETTVNAVAAAIAAAMNVNTLTTGWSAIASTATVTFTGPKNLGVYLNAGTPVVATLSAAATLAGTLTQPTGGTASKLAVMHYHISEYFRIQPQGNLFVGIFAVPGSYTFAEITLMQTFANGKIRQIGVYKDAAAFSTADITTIHGVCAANENAHKEIMAIYAADISGTADISTLADLATLTAPYCQSCIAQDGAAKGAMLYKSFGKSITVLGAQLGATSKAKVSESIAWVANFNMSNGVELDTVAFANGKLLTDSSISDNLLDNLQSKRYVFLRKFVGQAGSYFNENSVCVAVSADLAYSNDVRTMQKARRGIYVSLLPALNSPLQLNGDGTLSDPTIGYFESQAEAPLNQMIRDGEISAQQVLIDSTQNVLSTSTIEISAELVPVGVARNIIVKIGYQLSLS